MSDNRQLDELLNAYMDGQLTERRLTEVKRLLQHDIAVQNRLKELEKIRALVAALPREQAPADIVANVKQKLERRSLVASEMQDFDRDLGARHLLYRRLISAAAIIVLAIVLAGVIFVIVGPQPAPKNNITSANWNSRRVTTSTSLRAAAKAAPNALPLHTETTIAAETAETRHAIAVPDYFSARLELTAVPSDALDAFIKRSLVDNGITLIQLPVRETHPGVYDLRCSRASLRSFLADLATIWDKFDSAALVVATADPARNVIVPDVTAKQIDEIVSQTNLARSIQLAQDIGALNAVAGPYAGTAIARGTNVESLPIPKPVLTSPDTTSKQVAAGEPEMLSFVIQITAPR
jgi:anti-sigma factor RsiW